MVRARARAEALASKVHLGRDAARVMAAMRGGQVAVVSAILERRPQRWSAKVEPRPHQRSWSGLPPRLEVAPERYTCTVGGKRVPIAGMQQLMRLGMVTAFVPWRVRGRFRLSGSREILVRHLERILAARTPAELDRRAKAAWACFAPLKSATHQAVTDAMHERGRELCASRPRWGRLIPKFDNRTYRLRIGRAVYRVGRGQNGAGVRWAWQSAEGWALAAWRRRGVPEERARRAWDWWRSGYPHRALRVLEEGRRR